LELRLPLGVDANVKPINFGGERENMPDYRVYAVDEAGHISGMPLVIDCKDDKEAVERAKELKDGKALEVWLLDRRIAEIK
jgi:hypothetical protein